MKPAAAFSLVAFVLGAVHMCDANQKLMRSESKAVELSAAGLSLDMTERVTNKDSHLDDNGMTNVMFQSRVEAIVDRMSKDADFREGVTNHLQENRVAPSLDKDIEGMLRARASMIQEDMSAMQHALDRTTQTKKGEGQIKQETHGKCLEAKVITNEATQTTEVVEAECGQGTGEGYEVWECDNLEGCQIRLSAIQACLEGDGSGKVFVRTCVFNTDVASGKPAPEHPSYPQWLAQQWSVSNSAKTIKWNGDMCLSTPKDDTIVDLQKCDSKEENQVWKFLPKSSQAKAQGSPSSR